MFLGTIVQALGAVRDSIQAVANAIHQLTKAVVDASSFTAIVRFKLMFVVKDSSGPYNFTIDPSTAVDAKGVVIPNEQLDYAVVSDNDGVVHIDFDATKLTGVATIGTPGLANINATVTDHASGNVLGSFGAQFTVTAGDPAAIQGGDLNFGTLQPAASK